MNSRKAGMIKKQHKVSVYFGLTPFQQIAYCRWWAGLFPRLEECLGQLCLFITALLQLACVFLSANCMPQLWSDDTHKKVENRNILQTNQKNLLKSNCVNYLGTFSDFQLYFGVIYGHKNMKYFCHSFWFSHESTKWGILCWVSCGLRFQTLSIFKYSTYLYRIKSCLFSLRNALDLVHRKVCSSSSLWPLLQYQIFGVHPYSKILQRIKYSILIFFWSWIKGKN